MVNGRMHFRTNSITMGTFRNELDALEKKLKERYEELLKVGSPYVFLKDEHYDEDTIDDYFDVTCPNSGRTYECGLKEITLVGIYIVESGDRTQRRYVDFVDFTSTMDRVNIIELMETKNRQNEIRTN